MKNKFKIWLASAVILAITFASCSKKDSIEPNTGNIQDTEMTAPEITVLSDEADQDFANAEILGGTEEEAFSIPENDIPDAYQITEESADELLNSKRGNAGRFIGCLKGVNLSKEQVEHLRKAFKIYHGCHSSILMKYRSAMKDMLAKYNRKHAELVKAVRNGRITKEEFVRKVHQLRKEFVAERAQLASRVRGALKSCYTSLLKNMQRILNDRQWKAFVNCYRK